MPKIHFINGYVQDLTEDQFNSFMKRFNNSGLKYWINRDTGDIIPLTSPAIAMVERELPEPDDTKSKPVPDASTSEKEEEEPSVEKEPETPVNKAEVALEEMKAKSACGMNKHAGQNQIIFRQAFKAAKGGKQYYKYYPVCEFCGEKGRFIAADKLPDDVKDAALDHAED